MFPCMDCMHLGPNRDCQMLGNTLICSTFGGCDVCPPRSILLVSMESNILRGFSRRAYDAAWYVGQRRRSGEAGWGADAATTGWAARGALTTARPAVGAMGMREAAAARSNGVGGRRRGWCNSALAGVTSTARTRAPRGNSHPGRMVGQGAAWLWTQPYLRQGGVPFVEGCLQRAQGTPRATHGARLCATEGGAASAGRRDLGVEPRVPHEPSRA